MKASIYTQYGSPDVLTIKEIATPIPNDTEVLVKVYASTVNRTDCAMLRAKPFIMRFMTGLLKPKRPILGTDFAGRVEAVGKAVTSFKPGDRVYGFDDMGLSSHAQYLTIAETKALSVMPENLSYEAAAASCEGAHYAYNFVNKVGLKSGQRVLINGASGAIGSAAVQILKHFGLDVTAVCNTQSMALLRPLGVDQVIDYTKEDFTKMGGQYDFIFDAVGKSSFSKCKPLLKPRGIYISSELGWMAQNLFLALLTPLFGGKKVIFPIPVDVKGSMLFIKKLIELNQFKAIIDRQYALEQIAEAFTYVESGQKTGNVVIVMHEQD